VCILLIFETALLPLEDWRPEHIVRWRDSLPADDRANFKEFFENLPPGVKGSTLASYTLEALLLVFPKLGAFAPELYARLQALKGSERRQKRGRNATA
jgi:hypothetical protein